MDYVKLKSFYMAEGSFEQTERGTCRWENLPTMYLIIRSINVIDTLSRMYNKPIKLQEMARKHAAH